MNDCKVCKRSNAQWIAIIASGNGSDRLPVHRHCGNDLIRTAPTALAIKVVPSEELRREWRAKAFWGKKFQETKAAKAT